MYGGELSGTNDACNEMEKRRNTIDQELGIDDTLEMEQPMFRDEK
jgi:hypothetical protein